MMWGRSQSMTAQRCISPWILLVSFFGGGLIAGTALAEREVRTGAFSQVERIEHELQRGTSKKADVQRLLGAPSGLGEGVFPPDYKPHEVWYYEDIELKNIERDESGGMRGNLRQQQLLIFFEGEVMSGYTWTSNAGELENE